MEKMTYKRRFNIFGRKWDKEGEGYDWVYSSNCLLNSPYKWRLRANPVTLGDMINDDDTTPFPHCAIYVFYNNQWECFGGEEGILEAHEYIESGISKQEIENYIY